MCKFWLRLSNTRPFIHPDFCMFNGSFPQSKVCFADNWDLKKSNKRKQVKWCSLVTSSLTFGHAGLCERQGEKALWALFCLLSAPKQHWAVYDGAIATPCHPWESWRFNLPLPLSTQVSCSAGSLIFLPSLSMVCLSHSVHRHFDSLSGFWCNIYNVSGLRWICALFFKPKLDFWLFCV